MLSESSEVNDEIWMWNHDVLRRWYWQAKSRNRCRIRAEKCYSLAVFFWASHADGTTYTMLRPLKYQDHDMPSIILQEYPNYVSKRSSQNSSPKLVKYRCDSGQKRANDKQLAFSFVINRLQRSSKLMTFSRLWRELQPLPVEPEANKTPWNTTIWWEHISNDPE